jgi:hypothetical protein
MKRLIGLTLGIMVALCFAAPAAAQSKEDRLSGRIHMISKETSTITIDAKSVKRAVLYSPQTKITFRNKPGSMDDVKEGRRVIVLGKFNDKAQLAATRIDVREGR